MLIKGIMFFILFGLLFLFFILSIEYKIIDGVLLSWTWGRTMPWLHKKPLIEITEDEWRKDNGQYAPNAV